MPPQPEPLVVVLTPPGRGAVATVRVEGAGARAAADRVFHPASDKPLSSFPADRIVFGRIGGQQGEEAVARLQTDGSVEIHCHGGRAAIDRTVQMLVEQGCRLVSWQTWAERQYVDPFQADALRALADSRTERTAAILLDQFHGALREAFDSIHEAIERGETGQAREEIAALLRRGRLGLHLTRPWRVVVAGPPNAGKSSLMNALVGYGRAIVDPTAGTTRDVVTATAAIDGWPVEFSDTAGLRTTDDALERAGIELAAASAAAADLVLLVFDLTQPWTADDARLIEQFPGAIVVYNKRDLPHEIESARPAGLHASARAAISGIESINDLLQEISRRLVSETPPPGAAVPFTAEQLAQLQGILDTLLKPDA